MIFLLFNILFSSAFTLIIKWVHFRRREDILTVGPINYITAALLIAPQFFRQSAEPDLAAALCGAGMGASYFVAFFFVNYAIKEVGAAATTVVGNLSLLLPIVIAAFLWEEIPNLAQGWGVALAVAALIMIGTGRRAKKINSNEPASNLPDAHQPDAHFPAAHEESATNPWLIPMVLATFFLLAGSNRLLQRTLDHVSTKDQLPTFLFAAFVTAGIPSMVMLIQRRRRVSMVELGFGTAMGASNILQSHFILKALTAFEGYIVFPVSSSGGLLLTTFLATAIFHEKITRRTWTGIGIAVIALVLLNWIGD